MSENSSISPMIPTEQCYRNTKQGYRSDDNGIPLAAQRDIFEIDAS